MFATGYYYGFIVVSPASAPGKDTKKKALKEISGAAHGELLEPGLGWPRYSHQSLG